MIITPRQCRMARAAVNWTVRKLAAEAKIGVTTVVRFETEKAAPNVSTLTLIRQAFERAGVEFTNGDAPGVRMAR